MFYEVIIYFNVYPAIYNYIDQVCLAGPDIHNTKNMVYAYVKLCQTLIFMHNYYTTSHFLKNFKYNVSYYEQC